MSAITDRYSARKVLGLKTGRQTRQFIKNNNLSKVSTASIIERRTGALVSGYRRTAFGNMKQLSGYRLRKARNRVARRFFE
jgi:hypothetical protein